MFNSSLWKTTLRDLYVHVGAKQESICALPRIYIHWRDLNMHKSNCLLNISSWLFHSIRYYWVPSYKVEIILCTGTTAPSPCPHSNNEAYILLSKRHLKYGPNTLILPSPIYILPSVFSTYPTPSSLSQHLPMCSG